MDNFISYEFLFCFNNILTILWDFHVLYFEHIYFLSSPYIFVNIMNQNIHIYGEFTLKIKNKTRKI